MGPDCVNSQSLSIFFFTLESNCLRQPAGTVNNLSWYVTEAVHGKFLVHLTFCCYRYVIAVKG